VSHSFKRLCWTVVAVNILCSITLAAESGNANPFDKWLSPDAPDCSPISELKKAGASVATLTPEQFQFVRALYVAIPPMSKSLPPGETAIEAKIGDSVMIALVTGAQSCARFLAPDFILKMLDDVATGTSPKIGLPL
jgi:hypothetical protein